MKSRPGGECGDITKQGTEWKRARAKGDLWLEWYALGAKSGGYVRVVGGLPGHGARFTKDHVTTNFCDCGDWVDGGEYWRGLCEGAGADDDD